VTGLCEPTRERRSPHALRADLRRAGVVADAAHPGPLLEAIAQAVGARPFTTADLVRHANEASPHLLAVLCGFVAKPTPRSLGKLLSRVEGQELAGLVVQRLSGESAGVIWSVKPSGLSPNP